MSDFEDCVELAKANGWVLDVTLGDYPSAVVVLKIPHTLLFVGGSSVGEGWPTIKEQHANNSGSE